MVALRLWGWGLLVALMGLDFWLVAVHGDKPDILKFSVLLLVVTVLCILLLQRPRRQ